ncbi:MAG: PhzF family phenazine biosynthesis protein [Fibrobacteria bacterium]|nr:PhzF family phenazine biosynthesis protein [Fibrobacteria bacterium]
MKIPFYQIDTFTDEMFKGNAAGVCPLEQWISDKLMLKISAENNLSETAFFVKENHTYHIRWFTPTTEVDLCGHATLASAYVLFNHLEYAHNKVIFASKSGTLTIKRQNDLLQLDFPSQPPTPSKKPAFLFEGLGKNPQEILRAVDYIVIYKDESDIVSLNPDFNILNKIETRGICVTAPGKNSDFVSRFFAPRYGINEDPVTGSTHCALIPYWAKKLNKNKLKAKQLSKRGGTLYCELNNDRVLISGKATTYLIGELVTL